MQIDKSRCIKIIKTAEISKTTTSEIEGYLYDNCSVLTIIQFKCDFFSSA